MVERTLRIGVIGSGRANPRWDEWAYQVGQAIAREKGILVCGGLSGVMAAAARGARQTGGVTVGILPGTDARQADPNIQIPIPTGLGEARNLVVVQSSDALIAIGGGAGTLSEIGFALKLHKPLVLLGSWVLTPPEGAVPLPRPPRVAVDPAEAVRMALELAVRPAVER